MNEQFSTIYQLLEASQSQYRVFDMGRRVQKISQQDFKAFEDNVIAYPYPLQQKAWFAILFWDKQRAQQHYLWFLNFALDEQGKLIQATRSHFIATVLEILGTQLTGDDEQQGKLDNNPYTFKPDQQKLAALNAQIKVQMNQPASVYYEHSQSYISGALGWSQWHSVALQGLADFAMRIDQKDNLNALLAALDHLPLEVATPLCALLEHTTIPIELAEALVKKAEQACTNNDKPALINGLRALSHSQAAPLRVKLLGRVLTSTLATDRDILLVITGRCWLDLKDPSLRMIFLEQLATADQGLFVGVVSDLVAIPEIRQAMLHSFRDPNRSATLAAAIGLLFNHR